MILLRGLSITALMLLASLAGKAPAALAGESPALSIRSFSDLRPSDWAYQALINVANQYGCIEGYRNGSFDGASPLSRFEAAALLNSCLVRIGESSEELRGLQRELAQELAQLQGRVDGLEAKGAELAATQFSTTTRLRGEASFIFGGVNYGGDVAANGVGVSPFLPRQDALQMIYSLRIGLDTSYTGRDLLYTQLRTGNAASSPFNTFNPRTPWFTSTVPLAALERAFTPNGGNNVFNIERLFYRFPIGSQWHATVAARIMDMGLWGVYPSAYGVRGDNLLDFFSSFGTPGVYNKAVGSALGITWREKPGWNVGSWLAHAHYIAISPDNADFGGIGRAQSRGNIAAQFGYQSPQFNLTLGYRYGQAGTDFGRGTSFVAANQWSLPYLSGAFSNSVALNGYWRPPLQNRWLPAISAGWSLNALNNASILPGTFQPGAATVSQSQSWMVGLQWDNVSGISDVLGMAVGQPTFATALRNGQTPDDGNYALELFYRYPVSDHINVTPAIFYLSRPFGQLTVGTFNLFAALVQMNITF
jgi:hypothetical protein